MWVLPRAEVVGVFNQTFGLSGNFAAHLAPIAPL